MPITMRSSVRIGDELSVMKLFHKVVLAVLFSPALQEVYLGFQFQHSLMLKELLR